MGTWSDRLSYLDDPAFDLLWAVERVLRTSQPSAVKFDAEGHEYTIVFDRYDQFIITGGDTFMLTHVDMKLESRIALSRFIRLIQKTTILMNLEESMIPGVGGLLMARIAVSVPI